MAGETLLMYPSGFKATKLYSQIPTDGTGNFTVVRASIKTHVNSSRLIEEIAANVPSLDYTNGVCPVLDDEAQSTNLALWSEEFDNVYWSKNNSTLQSGILSPDGTNNAFKLIEDSTLNFHRLTTTAISVVSGTTYTFYFFISKNGVSVITLAAGNSNDLAINATFNLNTGTSVASRGVSKITEINDYYLCSVTGLSTATRTQSMLLYLNRNDIGFPYSYQGDGTSSVNIWGAKFATDDSSYIKTEGTTVTRLLDVVTVTPPVGTVSIVETIDDVDQTPITIIPGTFTVSEGNINKITMT